MGDWKLIEYFDDGTLELYNLTKDMGETSNLAKQQPKQTARLHAMLKAWRRATDAPVPTETNPQFDSEAWRKATRNR